LGFFGEKHTEVLSTMPNIKLLGVCRRSEKPLKEIAAKYKAPNTYTDYRELLANKEIEAVSITTMWEQHLEPTLAALKAGKHVFLEKPMASTVEDCKEIIQATKATDKFFIVGHICRFNPRYAAAKKEISEGAIGRIVSIYARRNIPATVSEEVLGKIGPITGDGVHDTSPNFSVCDKNGLRFPDTTYWPMLHNIRSGALREELSYFVHCILEGKKPTIIAPEESLSAVEGCLAAEESAKTGRIITLC